MPDECWLTTVDAQPNRGISKAVLLSSLASLYFQTLRLFSFFLGLNVRLRVWGKFESCKINFAPFFPCAVRFFIDIGLPCWRRYTDYWFFIFYFFSSLISTACCRGLFGFLIIFFLKNKIKEKKIIVGAMAPPTLYVHLPLLIQILVLQLVSVTIHAWSSWSPLDCCQEDFTISQVHCWLWRSLDCCQEDFMISQVHCWLWFTHKKVFNFSTLCLLRCRLGRLFQW